MTLAAVSDSSVTEVPDRPPPPTTRLRNLVPSVVPMLLMLAVGGFGLTHPALGWDEHATWSAAKRSPAQIYDLAHHMDGVIGPYYLFEHFWIGLFGDSLAMLRLPSLIAVAAGVGLAGELGRRLFGASAGLTAGLVLCLVPQLSYYAQEARAYGIAFCLSTLATLLLYLAVARPTWLRWIVYGVAVVAVGYAHMLALLIVAGHGFAVLVRWRREHDNRTLRALPVMVVAVALVVPLIRLGLSERGAELDWIGPVTLHTVVTAPGAIFGNPIASPDGLSYGGATAGLFVVGMAFVARWRRWEPIAELWALAVLPPAMLIAASFVTSSLWVPRYALPAVVPVALLAAVSLRGFRWQSVLALCVIAGLSVETQQAMRGETAQGGMDLRAAAGVIERNQRPGDAVVYGRVGSWSLRSGIDYELRHRSERPKDALEVRTAAQVGGLDAQECPALDCFGQQRVWYVAAHHTRDPLSDTGVRLGAKLRREYTEVQAWPISSGVVVLLRRK